MFDPSGATFWVMVSFLLFIGVLIYFGVPKIITGMLDKRANAIRDEIDQARRLREDAQALLADYQRKKAEAEEEAKEIIERARRDAEAMAADTRAGLKESIERRMKMAEEKIARAEAQAVNEVRGSAVDTALAAAERLLSDKVSGDKSASLISDGIKEVQAKLN